MPRLDAICRARLNSQYLLQDQADRGLHFPAKFAFCDNQGRMRAAQTTTDRTLTDILAERVMGWKVAPDRFIKSGRGWLPKWRFSPLSRIDDAFELLDRSASTYRLECTGKDVFAVEVQFGGRVGRASGEPKARAITLAVARALGLEVPQ